MPLLDHFHPPLSDRRSWESFHSYWASAIGRGLNAGLLPKGYFAEIQVSLAGARVEVDVGALEEKGNGARHSAKRPASKGGVATLTKRAWAPPSPQLEIPVVFPDEIEVLVLSTRAGPELVGAIELVSPRNKDRPAARRAFAMKCLAYLQRGVGVVVVDVVTERRANLHNEIARLLVRSAPRFPGKADLYAVAYRPYRLEKDERVAAWTEELAIGRPLPSMPLWLRGVPVPVRLDLEVTHGQACRDSGIGPASPE
ncbi:MAG: DUF4058 family protein [Gemmataceae bacterium]